MEGCAKRPCDHRLGSGTCFAPAITTPSTNKASRSCLRDSTRVSSFAVRPQRAPCV